MPDLDIPDDGFLTVKIGAVTQTVDAYQSYNHVAGLRSKYPADISAEEVIDYHTSVVEYLLSLGFERVSHYASARFVDALFAAVDTLRGNAEAGPTPGSPASTEPTPSDSPAE